MKEISLVFSIQQLVLKNAYPNQFWLVQWNKKNAIIQDVPIIKVDKIIATMERSAWIGDGLMYPILKT